MLREYQIAICERVNEAFEAHRSVMMQMPTGTGKTVVLASLVKGVLHGDADGSVLIVAHRMELIEQTGAFLERFGITYGVIAGGKRPKAWMPVMVASVQTLSAQLGGLEAALSPSLIVIDEAHHALAKSYQMLWRAWPKAKFLGLTATPYRLSGEGFTDLFEVLVESWSIKQFIADGWLSPYDYYSIRPDSEVQREIDGLKKRGADGDFQMKELRERLDVRPSIERLFESFERFAFDIKGIIYAIDIAHAEHIAKFYRLQGVAAEAISSKTPTAERQRLLGLFKHRVGPDAGESLGAMGSLQVLVSVDLFSEGFDCPDVEFIQLARPTLSLTKYLQMVGRGLRPSPGKRCCTILDNVGLYRTFGLPSVDRDWGSYFLGREALGWGSEVMANGNEQFLWLGGDLREESDRGIVKIVSYHCTSPGRTGFERRKRVVMQGGKRREVWVWMDLISGVEFERYPQVINYRGMELCSADGESFFPRVRSKWMDGKHGINRKALETQVGEGMSWMKLYISFAQPDRVLQLQAVKPNQMRLYKDEQGRVYLQQDLDHAPIPEEEAGGRKLFMALCDKAQRAWEETKRGIRQRTLAYDEKRRWWRLPEGSVKALWDERHGVTLYHITTQEGGEFWVDERSGFTYRHRPVIRKRGFVELLQDGEEVYILNIHEERFMPYRSWEIRADEQLCTIGNKLYFSKEREKSSYRIKRRSDDFRMFVVEERLPNDNPQKIEFDEFMIINKSGQELEVTKM